MRRTPPVVAHLQPQPGLQVVVALIATLAATGLAAWLINHDTRAWPVLLSLPLVLVWVWRAAAVAPRRLHWDGEAWWLAEPGRDKEVAVELTLIIDLDFWLLLRATPGPRWLPLLRSQQPLWGALRATLFSAPRVASRQ